MIELIFMCVIGNASNTPCPPPPPPPPTEQMVGLPAKNVELVEEEPEFKIVGTSQKNPAGFSSFVQKLPQTVNKSVNYNRRGMRNH